MNKILLIILFMFSVSCSSSFKGKKQGIKHLPVKSFSLHGPNVYNPIEYYSTMDNDQHCFKDNPHNKEIITVRSGNVSFAIDHFYKRTTKVDIKRVHSRGVLYVDVKTTEETNFELEMAECYTTSSDFFINSGQLMTSFRLKN